jgi:hypothetical protein
MVIEFMFISVLYYSPTPPRNFRYSEGLCMNCMKVIFNSSMKNVAALLPPVYHLSQNNDKSVPTYLTMECGHRTTSPMFDAL